MLGTSYAVHLVSLYQELFISVLIICIYLNLFPVVRYIYISIISTYTFYQCLVKNSQPNGFQLNSQLNNHTQKN